MVVLVALAPASQLKPATSITGADAPAAPATEANKDSRAIYEARVDRAMDRPAVKAAMDELKAGLLDYQELERAGGQLLEALRKSPDIAASAPAFKEKLVQSAAVKQIILDTTVEKPDWRRALALASKRAERNRQGAAWNKSVAAAASKFASRPLISAAVRSLVETGDIRVEDAIVDRLTARLADPKFVARLIELDGGKTPDAEASQNLLLKHVFTEERCETFVVQFLKMPLLKKELAGALVTIIESDEVKTIITSRLAKLLGDEQFQRLAVNVIDIVLSENPTAAQFEGTLTPLLESPVLEESVVGALVDVKKCENLNGSFRKAVESVFDSDEFREVFESAFLSNL